MPSSAMTSTMHAFSSSMPSVGPYWSARAEASAATRDISAATSSDGKYDVSGSPPASEITSGRAVIAMRSRIADDFISCVRRANSPAYRSRSRAVVLDGLMARDSPPAPGPLGVSSIVMPPRAP